MRLVWTGMSLRSTWTGRLAGLLLKPALRELRKKLDQDEYGAVPLLGVGAPVFIGHGSSSARSIESSLRVAETFVRAHVNEAIQTELRELAEVASAVVEAPASPPSAHPPSAFPPSAVAEAARTAEARGSES